MIILGIDPGYATIGFGLLECNRGKFRTLHYGVITTPPDMEFDGRLEMIYNDLTLLLAKAKPDAVAIEQLFFFSNKTTAIDVAQARGVIVLAVKQAHIPIHEYTPLQVKMGVVGYGRAEKHQVMEMTRQILGLEKIPRPDDAADALAIAICHGHSAASLLARIK